MNNKKRYQNINADDYKIEVDPNLGLTSEQVNRQCELGLVNKTKKHVTKSYASIIFTNLFSYFNILLFVIFGFMCFRIKELYASMFFMVILLSNIIIGLIQDIRARIKTDKLRLVTQSKALVIRDGKELYINSEEIVLSDVIILKTGNQILCDGTVINGCLSVNESLLTGEADDIKKDISSRVMSGSFVTSGNAKIVVDQVGEASYIESLRKKATSFNRPNSELLIAIKRLFNVICIIVTALGALLIISDYCQYLVDNSKSFAVVLKSISGSLVSMIPSGMYLLTSLTLAAGVVRLSLNKMLVQELYCIEMLARVDTICFDKTGTLTTGNMLFDRMIIKDNSYNESKVSSLIKTLLKATGDNNATAKALIYAFEQYDLFEISGFECFSSKTKCSSITLKNNEKYILGAAEFILDNSNVDLFNELKEISKKGFRTLVFVKDNGANKDIISIIVLKDEINQEAKDTIYWFVNNDVKIKIISGDNIYTTSFIANEVGVPNSDKCISLEGKTIEEVKELAKEYTVFGRVSPEQKEAIIVSIKENGGVAAMTGDGVNDILALKRADCSIAMSNGSDAVKDISYLVSMDSNFSSLPKVVKEGRRVINNLQRTCSIFLVKTTFAILTTIFFLILQWINPKNSFPFSTNNLYVWEFCTIGVAGFLLALQDNDERLKGTFLSTVLKTAVPAGIIQLLIAVILYSINAFGSPFFDNISWVSCATILLIMFSYVVLAKVCSPFDKYRTIVFVSMVILGLGAFGVDFTLFKLGFLDSTNSEISALLNIGYNHLNYQNILISIGLMLVIIPIYIGFARLINIFIMKRGKKNASK